MTKYLLDSNCFIEPMKRYYGFDTFPTYWKWFSNELNKDDSLLVVPKCVSNEINVDSRLKKWAQDNMKGLIYNEYHDPTVWPKFGEVIQYIHDCGAYKSSSINEWEKDGKADPLLIAIASQYGYQIVTFEKETGQFVYDENNQWNWKGTNGPSKKEPKIPDVAKHFGVTCITLFDLEQKLKLSI